MFLVRQSDVWIVLRRLALALVVIGWVTFTFVNLNRTTGSLFYVDYVQDVPQPRIDDPSRKNGCLSDEELPSLTERLPQWLQDYAKWHKEQRAQLNETNWRSNTFLIMTAKKGPAHAGGVADRLRPLPYYVKLAATTNRILLIHWTRPFSCEHFLLPPRGGVDWRVPHYMVEDILNIDVLSRRRHIDVIRSESPTVIRCQMQDWAYGEDFYDKHPLVGDLDETNHPNATMAQRRIAVTRDIWDLFFTPSPPVARRIQEEYDRMGITPGHYASAHIRAVHSINTRKDEEIREMAQWALDCASMLRPGGPFFVAADSSLAVTAAIEYGQSKNVTVVTTQYRALDGSDMYQPGPFHLDLYNWTDPNVVPEDFYETFVDLYLFRNTNCISHGFGSFGQFGRLMGYNSTCTLHWYKSRESCKWTDPKPDMINNGTAHGDASYSSGTNLGQPQFSRLTFRQPMDYDTIYSLC